MDTFFFVESNRFFLFRLYLYFGYLDVVHILDKDRCQSLRLEVWRYSYTIYFWTIFEFLKDFSLFCIWQIIGSIMRMRGFKILCVNSNYRASLFLFQKILQRYWKTFSNIFVSAMFNNWFQFHYTNAVEQRFTGEEKFLSQHYLT